MNTADCGYHFRCEFGLQRACQEIPSRVRPAQGAGLCDRKPYGGGAAPESGRDCELGYIGEAGAGTWPLYPSFRL